VTETVDGAGVDRIEPRLLEALARRGIRSLTEIQELAIPLVDSDDDALLLSPTGTGKTEAALLPLVTRLLREPRRPTGVLYITPLRALNRDLEHRLLGLVREVGLTAAVRHGDTSTADRTRQSRRPPDLLLTTPETLQILLVGRRLREALRHVRAVIVDELHELAPSDRGAQLMVTLERLDAFAGRPVRRIGLSATVGNPEAVARYLSPEPRIVEVRAARRPRPVTIDAVVPVAGRPPLAAGLVAELRAEPVLLEAIRTVEELVRGHRSTLVFVNTRPTAEGLAARLRRLAPDLPIAVHHGSLAREARAEAERQFREGELRAIVATSSLELGIDIGVVDLVVQFGSPHQASRLLQRAGRSGHRIDREVRGTVVALDDDDLEEAAVLARRAVARDLEPIGWRTRHRLAAAQQILAELRAEGSADAERLAATFGRAAPARDLTAADWFELVAYLEGLGSLKRDGRTIRPGRGTLHRFYATLSLIPDERTYRLRDIATRRLVGTLDERFVLTQVMAEPELIFLLHGQTWKVVEFRDAELLVEGVAEIGQEPRWVGEDLPVPFEVAQEIGRLRRTGDLSPYPIGPTERARLAARGIGTGEGSGGAPTDRRITITPQGRIVAFGACLGTRTNTTLALAASGLLTARLGARVEVLAVEPTSFVLGLPIAVDPATLAQSLAIEPAALEGLLERLVPSGLEYRWVLLTVARKFGVLPPSVDPRDLRVLEPLIEQSRGTPLGEEALEKTLAGRFDVPHAREVLAAIGAGTIEVRLTPPGPWSDGPLARLRWRELPDVPPPTLLKAVETRLRAEELTLVCLRCGFVRTTTPARYAAEGGSLCRLCKGALSGVLSPRRVDEIEALRQYARRKRRGAGPPRRVAATLPPLVRAAYTSAELVAHFGERALLCLAARGVGPETARRLLARMYRNDAEFFTELLKAERSYARTRSFWD